MSIPDSLDQLYGTIFPSRTYNPYPASRVEAIQQNRSQLDGTLFIDILFSFVAQFKDSVQAHYPPKTAHQLRRLFAALQTTTTLDTLKKNALTYYLLLDYIRVFPSAPGTPSPAIAFARRFLLPRNFITIITALHFLDNLQFDAAMPYLTDPSVTPQDPEKIVKSLYSHGRSDLAVAFVECTQPTLETEETVSIYFRAQMDLSPESAFLYIRAMAPGYLKAGFLKELVEHCITVRPSENALKLLNLPLDEDEKAIFVECLKGNGLDVARDTLLVWQMHQGHIDDALKGMSAAAAKGVEMGGLDWGALGEGLRKGLGSRIQGASFE